MNKREQNTTQTAAWERVQMKRALRRAGFTLTGDEPTDLLEELVLVTFAPSVQQFDGVVTRAKEAVK